MKSISDRFVIIKTVSISVLHQRHLKLLINTIISISKSSTNFKLKYLIILTSINYVVIYLYLWGSFKNWISHHSHNLSIKDVQRFEYDSLLISNYIDKSYFPEIYFKSYFPNLTAYVYSKSNLSLDQTLFNQLNKEYDPRLLPALWISEIFQHLKRNNDTLDPSFTLPFSWASFLDLKSSFQTIPLPLSINELNCDNFQNLFKFNYSKFSNSCVNLENAPDGYPKLKITEPIDYPASEDARKIIGSNYLLNSASLPERVYLLGVGPHEGGIVVPFTSIEGNNSYNKNDLKYLIDNFISSKTNSQNETRTIFEEGISLSDEVRLLNDYWFSLNEDVSFIKDEDLNYDIFRVADNSPYSDIYSLHLNKTDFIFNVANYKKSLEEKLFSSYKKSVINDFDRRILSLVQSGLKDQPNFTKYFNEAFVIGTYIGSHYDWRFFKRLHYSIYEKKAILHRLTRAWLMFANTVGLKTWIAHGSLLGWYWNGMSLPWDQDLDVQMTMDSLIKLARNYNQTLVVDLTAHDAYFNQGVGSYLIDVSSSFFNREKGNGNNAIDARFIDTRTGFYVDITALAFTDAARKISVKRKQSSEFNQLLDPDFITKDRSNTIVKEDLYSQLYAKRASLWNNQNIFNCRNNHFYVIEELSPLVPTLFEGVKAFVPKHYKSILKREYNRGLLNYQYQGHTFRPVLDLWVPSRICKKDIIGNKCFDKETLLEAKYTKPLTIRHRNELQRSTPTNFGKHDELKPIRIDPWLIHRSKKIIKLIYTFN